jgi:hypothetical protein
MFALWLAQVYPELDDDTDDEPSGGGGAHNSSSTAIPWDYNSEFVCSKLAVYFEVHNTANGNDDDNTVLLVHPESVELLKDQASTLRFYESPRALWGDEGPEMVNLAHTMEQTHLSQQITA